MISFNKIIIIPLKLVGYKMTIANLAPCVELAIYMYHPVSNVCALESCGIMLLKLYTFFGSIQQTSQVALTSIHNIKNI